ncbi:ABC transporter permease, partial [Paramuribaculum intestinale]|uniref:ABC transporter permease n=1 Tax=Paramuribaculum intestinale TaxID=2094151 RepID=UPI0025AA2993
GLSRGLISGFEEQSGKRDINTIDVWRGSTSIPYKGYNKGRQVQLKASTVDALNKSGNKYIGKATAYKYIDSAKVTGQKDYVAGGIMGMSPESRRDQWIDMFAGRYINQADMDNNRKVMVISRKTAKTIFGSDSTEVVGKYVKSLGLSWQIIGLYTREWGEDDSYVPFTTAIALSGGDANIWSMRILADNVNDEVSATAAEDAIRGELAKIHNFDSDDKSATPMWNRFTNYLQNKKGMMILDYAVWIIGIFTMLSGIVGVSNIMFVSVRERTHEIGIRRAIGAKRRNILTQVILESVSITTIFGYIGVVMGMIVMQVIGHFFGSEAGGHSPLGNPTVDLSIALKVTVVLIIAGALAGLFPALKATKVKPVEALRDE